MQGVLWYEPVANLLLFRWAIGMIETILKESVIRPLASPVEECRVLTSQSAARWVSIP